ncbi:MAG TPA: helix-turn-helix domain-containing protein [Solirubrobacteraceae bacterium]|nr:helix-turn-helix domain-containing protein [Solirubrobacteraceae bacterium]
MSDIARMVRPDVVPASVQHVDGLVGPLAAYLDALEARVAALERRLTAVPLMTAADAARYARVNVETILRAVRAGELSVTGYVGRSPRISRDALGSWIATRSSAVAPPPALQPRRRRGRKASDAVEAAWEALG